MDIFSHLLPLEAAYSCIQFDTLLHLLQPERGYRCRGGSFPTCFRGRNGGKGSWRGLGGGGGGVTIVVGHISHLLPLEGTQVNVGTRSCLFQSTFPLSSLNSHFQFDILVRLDLNVTTGIFI